MRCRSLCEISRIRSLGLGNSPLRQKRFTFRHAEEIRASGYNRAVTLTANRAGSHPGTHEIGFDSPVDTITLRHTARSRDGFARGALRAARWIAGKKGVFEFREILSELG